MKRQAQNVDRRFEQGRIDAVDQRPQRAIGRDHRQMAIDDQRRARFMRRQHRLKRRTHHIDRGLGEIAFGKGRREPRREQQSILVAPRHVELFRQAQQQIAAWFRVRFDEAQMTRGDIGIERDRVGSTGGARASRNIAPTSLVVCTICHPFGSHPARRRRAITAVIGSLSNPHHGHTNPRRIAMYAITTLPPPASARAGV